MIVLCIGAEKFWRIRNPPAFLPRPLLRAGKEPRQNEKSFPPEKQIFVLPSPY